MRLEDKEDKMKEKNIKSVSVFLISQIISLFGSSIVSYAIVWYITMKTSSTVALAVSIVCTYMPQILVSIFSGTWGDRYNKKYLIMIGDIITGISTLILAVLFINGFDSLLFLYSIIILRSIAVSYTHLAALPGEEEWELLWLPPPCQRKELARPLPAIKSSAIIFPPVFPTLTPRLAIKLSIF